MLRCLGGVGGTGDVGNAGEENALRFLSSTPIYFLFVLWATKILSQAYKK